MSGDFLVKRAPVAVRKRITQRLHCCLALFAPGVTGWQHSPGTTTIFVHEHSSFDTIAFNVGLKGHPLTYELLWMLRDCTYAGRNRLKLRTRQYSMQERSKE